MSLWIVSSIFNFFLIVLQKGNTIENDSRKFSNGHKVPRGNWSEIRTVLIQ